MIKPRKAFYAFRGFQLVDKVDKLLDGDAGSRRLVTLALLPLSPPVPPLLLKTAETHVFPPVFAYKVCLRGTCPRKHRLVTRPRFFRFPNGGFPFFDRLQAPADFSAGAFLDRLVLDNGAFVPYN